MKNLMEKKLPLIILTLMLLLSVLQYMVNFSFSEEIKEKDNMITTMQSEINSMKLESNQMLDYIFSMKSKIDNSTISFGNKNYFPDGTYCYRGIYHDEIDGKKAISFINTENCQPVVIEDVKISKLLSEK